MYMYKDNGDIHVHVYPVASLVDWHDSILFDMWDNLWLFEYCLQLVDRLPQSFTNGWGSAMLMMMAEVSNA